MEHDYETLRKQAQSISSAAKAPGDAWKELRSWASEGGPMAMDIAVQEFITSYGRDPASARMIPEIMHGVHLSPLRKDFGTAPLSRGHVAKHSPALLISPKPVMGVSRGDTLSLKPLQVLAAPLDPMSMRDMPLRMHEGLNQSLRLPMRQGASMRQGGKDRSQPDGVRALSAGRSGENILQSLIGHLSSHGRNDLSGRKPKKAGKPAKASAPAAKKKAKKAAPASKRKAKKRVQKRDAPAKKRSARKNTAKGYASKKRAVKAKPQKRRASRKR